ncbi:unnamed protein product [Prorocentrum cordatum]|uniref:EF-hand domain-containing protein n=1 Tax=Prorocentrum cordatum TaxID=2364126 RepID=A0ABN9Y607_9DINO|nr:unnamed protein product [Polarella glacialis]
MALAPSQAAVVAWIAAIGPADPWPFGAAVPGAAAAERSRARDCLASSSLASPPPPSQAPLALAAFEAAAPPPAARGGALGLVEPGEGSIAAFAVFGAIETLAQLCRCGSAPGDGAETAQFARFPSEDVLRGLVAQAMAEVASLRSAEPDRLVPADPTHFASVGGRRYPLVRHRLNGMQVLRAGAKATAGAAKVSDFVYASLQISARELAVRGADGAPADNGRRVGIAPAAERRAESPGAPAEPHSAVEQGDARVVGGRRTPRANARFYPGAGAAVDMAAPELKRYVAKKGEAEAESTRFERVWRNVLLPRRAAGDAGSRGGLGNLVLDATAARGAPKEDASQHSKSLSPALRRAYSSKKRFLILGGSDSSGYKSRSAAQNKVNNSIEDLGADDPLDQDSWHRQLSGSATYPSSSLASLKIAEVVHSEPAADSGAATSRASPASPARTRSSHGGGSAREGPAAHGAQPAAEEPEDSTGLGIQVLELRPGASASGSAAGSAAPKYDSGQAAHASDGSLLRRLGRRAKSSLNIMQLARKGSSGSIPGTTPTAGLRGVFFASGLKRPALGSSSSLGSAASRSVMSLGKSTSSLFASAAELPQSPAPETQSPAMGAKKSEDTIGNAVVALIHMVADGSVDGIAGSRRSSIDWGRTQISELIDALDDEPDAKAQFSNHCYFYNLAIRGRRPKCMYKACECGRVHERIPEDVFENFPFPALQDGGLGSDAELRKRFVEMDTGNDSRLCEREVQDAIVRAGVTPKLGQIGIIMKLLVETDRGFIYFPEFCQMGRLSLQYNTVCGLTPPQTAPHLQEGAP